MSDLTQTKRHCYNCVILIKIFLSGHAYLTAGHRSYREDKTTSYKSSTDAYMQKVPVQLENTYKMEPDTYFPQHKVETIIHDILKENLQEVQYDGALMGSKARMLSDLLKEKVKSLKMDRFKIISWVVICERQDNSLRIVSRELWDAQHDNFASVVFESTSLYAVGNVYAVYQE